MWKVDGLRIRQRRKELGLSQDDLAKLVGVSKVMICWYESGDRTPSLEKFLKIADALGLSLDEVSGREASVVSEEDVDYSVKLPKQDLVIINELKKHPHIYKMLYNDPVRTVKLINRKLK